jgi:HD superfamily phosphodiesterase
MTGDILEDVKRVCTANQATHAYLWRHLLNVANEAKKLAKRFDFDGDAVAQFFINYIS